MRARGEERSKRRDQRKGEQDKPSRPTGMRTRTAAGIVRGEQERGCESIYSMHYLCSLLSFRNCKFEKSEKFEKFENFASKIALQTRHACAGDLWSHSYLCIHIFRDDHRITPKIISSFKGDIFFTDIESHQTYVHR